MSGKSASDSLWRWRARAAGFFCAALFLVYSLPGVVALRNTFTVLAFLLVLPELIDFLRNASQLTKRSILIFAALLCWTLVVAIFISNDPSSSLSEWKGEWLPPAIGFFAGLGVSAAMARYGHAITRDRFWLIILVPLTVLMAVQLVWVAAEYFRVGSISPHFSSFSDHKANITYAACTLLPLVLAFAVRRADGVRSVGRRLYGFASISGVLAVIAVITSGARNGVIVTFVGVFTAGTVMLANASRANLPKRIQAIGLIAFLAVVFVIAWAGIEWDPRWQRFIQTVPVALDTETHLEWLDPPGSKLPVTANGEPAEESAYLRIAWARIGVGMLLEHPWGLEISRNTFHDLVVERYGRGSMAHAHNSIIDFGLNVGFPGLALWLAFIWTLVVVGWEATRSQTFLAGWALMFLVMMYFLRSLLDSIMRDHILEQFMLTAGILLGSIACAQPKDANE